MNNLRFLPSVEKLLQNPEAAELILEFGRALTLDAIHHEMDVLRRDAGSGKPIPAETPILDQTREILETWTAPTLEPVINATGLILHTNLGRAPLSEAALENVKKESLGYCTLEFDLNSGKRGSRSVHADNLLRRITGAEAALVVNMGGYNTLCELLSLKKVSLVVPREQPRLEQTIRAKILAQRGLADFIPWNSLAPDLLHERIEALLSNREAYLEKIEAFPMTGLNVIRNRLAAFREAH